MIAKSMKIRRRIHDYFEINLPDASCLDIIEGCIINYICVW